jgi:hypothetical protein
MSDATSEATSPFWRLLRCALFILPAIFIAGSLHAGESTAAGESGIKGKVLVGPAYPGPEIVGEADEVPFRGVFLVLNSDEKEVARFESDEKGCFKVLLAPGAYTVVPDKSAPIPFPKRQKKEVTVPEEGFADVTLTFDTGMR